jgi:hypothetical protein
MVQKESKCNLSTPWPAACRPSPTEAKKTKLIIIMEISPKDHPKKKKVHSKTQQSHRTTPFTTYNNNNNNKKKRHWSVCTERAWLMKVFFWALTLARAHTHTHTHTHTHIPRLDTELNCGVFLSSNVNQIYLQRWLTAQAWNNRDPNPFLDDFHPSSFILGLVGIFHESAKPHLPLQREGFRQHTSLKK